MNHRITLGREGSGPLVGYAFYKNQFGYDFYFMLGLVDF